MQVFHWRDEPVAQPRPRLDIPRTLRPIPKHAAQLVHRRVQAMVECHIGIWPKPCAKRLPPDHLSCVFDQRLQDLKGFFFQLDAHPMLANLAQFERNFERAEARYRR